MTHGGVQLNCQKISNRIARDADSRVALPRSFSPPNTRIPRSFGTIGAFPTSMADVNANATPTIVQSSAEQATAQNGDDVAQSNSFALVQRDEAENFTTDLSLTDVDKHDGHYINFQGEAANYDPLLKDVSQKYLIVNQKVSARSLNSSFSVCLVFDDTRDGDHIKKVFQSSPGQWSVHGISHQQYAKMQDVAQPLPPGRDPSFKYDGQVIFQATFIGTKVDVIDIDNVSLEVSRIASKYGEVRVMKKVATSQEPSYQFRVEYFKISDAKKAVKVVNQDNPQNYNGWKIAAHALVDGQPGATPPTTHVAGAIGIQCSPTGRTAWTIDEFGVQIIQQPTNIVPKFEAATNFEIEYDFGNNGAFDQTPGFRGRHTSLPAPDVHNTLDMSRSQTYGGTPNVSPNTQMTSYRGKNRRGRSLDDPAQRIFSEKINAGADTRTTIMIRNLPNSWTAADLKKILDNTIGGFYDFSYLRIDFSHNTNVGYAFVNTVDCQWVLNFYNTWHMKEWQCGQYPRKICEVSYATIQGLDNLIEKFRNSSIMDEFIGFRPKLFWTWETTNEGTKIGGERPFPGPNNVTKKQRSNENAGQIGLYAPRNGHRGSDRARRSQFDRGTTAQIIEDGMYSNYSICSPTTSRFHNGFNNGVQVSQYHVPYMCAPGTLPLYTGNFAMANPMPIQATFPRSTNFNVAPSFYTGIHQGHVTAYDYPPQGNDAVNHMASRDHGYPPQGNDAMNYVAPHDHGYPTNGSHGHHQL